MASGGKGAKKTVGKARKQEGVRPTVRMYYILKPNGAYALRFKRLEVESEPELAAEEE